MFVKEFKSGECKCLVPVCPPTKRESRCPHEQVPTPPRAARLTVTPGLGVATAGDGRLSSSTHSAPALHSQTLNEGSPPFTCSTCGTARVRPRHL